ncbi:MAG: biotin/lipoyl-binding protein, partial [Rhizobiales bacterium]|nr:biotin/lipoyl-binding protein [Hyphomicrobiales bacterium]
MIARRAVNLVVLLAVAAATLAACGKGVDRGYQGWVEAELIFVSPDEDGRVETLSVREGDVVEKGASLFTVDQELQRANVDMAKASLTNAHQAFERAQALLKTAAGTQKAVDDAQAALRTELGPVVEAVTQLSHADIRLRDSAGQLIEVFAREIFETRRKDVIRLV